MTEKLAMGLREAAESVGLSHWTLRKMIAEGKLPSIRLNRRVLVETETLRRLVQQGRDKGKEQSNG